MKLIEAYNAPGPGVPLGDGGRMTLLDLHVVDRATVEVHGVWVEHDHAIVVTDEGFAVRNPKRGDGFIFFRGYDEIRGEPKKLGRLPIIEFEGPLETPMLEALLGGSTRGREK